MATKVKRKGSKERKGSKSLERKSSLASSVSSGSRHGSIDSGSTVLSDIRQVLDETQLPRRKKGGEDQWEFRTYNSRVWGNTLADELKKKTGGSTDTRAVKKLTSTLKDARAASENSLRRTAIEALVPASKMGNKGALLAQANALGDQEYTVRRAALRCLHKAAGGEGTGKRSKLESGGAVAVALAETLPQIGNSESTEVRRAAANALAELAPQQDKELGKIAFSWVDDEDGLVRAHATRALGVAASGPKALEAIKQSLADWDWRVSKAAIYAMTKLDMKDTGSRPGTGESQRSRSSKRSGHSLYSLHSTRTSSQASRSGMSSSISAATAERAAVLAKANTPAEVLAETCRSNFLRGLPRADAVEALGKVSSSGKPDVRKSAMLVAADQLTDVDKSVRDAAVSALQKLAPGDHMGTIRATASQLTCSDFRARESAAKALAAVSKADSTTAFSLAASTLEEDDWRRRRGAALALQKLGRLDDGNARESVFDVLIPRLEHPDWSIRRKATQALGEVAKGLGDPRALKLLGSVSRDPDEEVRIAVVEALPGLAPPKKSKDSILMASTFARDPNPRIRIAALNALEVLAAPERSRSRVAVHAVNDCVRDVEEEVRLTAQRVMATIAPGRRTGIDAAAASLTDPDPEKRKIAVKAFIGVAPSNRDRAMKRVVPLLRHPDEGVRESATEAMRGMMNDTEADVVAAAARAVAKFRRRFAAPAGHGDMPQQVEWDEEEDEDDYDETVQPVLQRAKTGELGGADLDSEQSGAEHEDEESEIKEDTDTEDELSESDTDKDSDEDKEANDNDNESRRSNDSTAAKGPMGVKQGGYGWTF